MNELPAKIANKVDKIAVRGNTLIDKDRYQEAITEFKKGIDLLPPPREQWDAFLWFLCGIGDAQWFMEDHENGLVTWRDAILHGGLGNAFVHMRRGQVLFELGDRKEAANELLRALLLGGEQVFETKEPKYLELVKSVAAPPEGYESWDGWQGVDEDSPTYDWLMDPEHYALKFGLKK
jgi:tetratricopeptide (TPR) repeat protein